MSVNGFRLVAGRADNGFQNHSQRYPLATDSIHDQLVYVGLESERECQDRVQSRVAKGGHDVPPAIIEQRYHQSLSLLKQNYKEFDRIELVDNTSRLFQPGALIEQGRVAPLQAPPAEWVKGVATHVQRLERINQLLTQPAAEMQQATIRVTEAVPGAKPKPYKPPCA